MKPTLSPIATCTAKNSPRSADPSASYALRQPEGGFTTGANPIDDREFSRQLLKEQHITVMPGTFWVGNPIRATWRGHVRIACGGWSKLPDRRRSPGGFAASL